jgi:hypothetical protein
MSRTCLRRCARYGFAGASHSLILSTFRRRRFFRSVLPSPSRPSPCRPSFSCRSTERAGRETSGGGSGGISRGTTFALWRRFAAERPAAFVLRPDPCRLRRFPPSQETLLPQRGRAVYVRTAPFSAASPLLAFSRASLQEFSLLWLLPCCGERRTAWRNETTHLPPFLSSKELPPASPATIHLLLIKSSLLVLTRPTRPTILFSTHRLPLPTLPPPPLLRCSRFRALTVRRQSRGMGSPALRLQLAPEVPSPTLRRSFRREEA